ncbi:hypothetical protein BC829DRAFT_386757 [Chytridium lagenaria]|nr:hypothetical protein BC829DRAFT_386757 [Chytridium lagenaria]
MAYERSAEVCMDAENFGEFLKTQTLLINQIYPNLASSLEVSLSSTKSEMTCYYLLYFLCFSSNAALPCGDSWTVQHILSHPHISLVIRLIRTLQANFNFIQFQRLWSNASPRARVFLRLLIPRFRARTWTTLAKSYYVFNEKDLLALLLWGHGDKAEDQTGGTLWKLFVETHSKLTNAPQPCVEEGIVYFRRAKARKHN